MLEGAMSSDDEALLASQNSKGKGKGKNDKGKGKGDQ
jgi:hypothetical protein